MSRRQAAACLLVAASLTAFASPPVAAATKSEPSILHGASQVIAGLVFELPKTVLDATLNGPPVVGTAVGLLAGTARALQMTVGGLIEMADGFDPWGTKRR